VTERLISAIGNPHVDIIGHPTGRLLPDREGADLDMDAVFKAAVVSGVAMEINANPYRLDLDDVYARRAVELGIPITINTDAHAPGDFDYLHFGIATARRGWVEPDNVINTWKPERLIHWLKARGIKMPIDDRPVVYSTADQGRERCKKCHQSPCRCPKQISLPPEKQTAHIQREKKGRGGKTVIVIWNLQLSKDDLKIWGKNCGVSAEAEEQSKMDD
jgi:hypothetical protein